jgi:hypothetical protein
MPKEKSVLDLTKSIAQIGKEIKKERKKREKILKNLPKDSPWRNLGWGR